MHAQVYKHHAGIVADQMFLRALDLAVNEEGIIDKKRLGFDPSPSANNEKFLDFYTGLDDRSIYDVILQSKPDGKASEILKRINARKLLKRVFEFLPDKEVENVQIRARIMKMKESAFKNISDEIATKTHLEKHNVIVYRAEIPVNLYENEIMIMWKGIPRSLDEFSPIKSSESTINKFYIFGPNDKTVQDKIAAYVEKEFQIPSSLRFSSN